MPTKKNLVDSQGRKQGYWEEISHGTAPILKPNFIERGYYVNNRKEGMWTIQILFGEKYYTLKRNYIKGGVFGICQYFDYKSHTVKTDFYAD